MKRSENTSQRLAYESIYDARNRASRAFHDSDDPLVRYLRDRRLVRALTHLAKLVPSPFSQMDALVVCGGVGGEGTFLANSTFRRVWVADFSMNAMAECAVRDPRLVPIAADTQALPMADGSVDVVIVQDGLHELRNPPLGFLEMLRVARKATLVVEPHTGFIGRMLGKEWETHGNSGNYVFRWNGQLIRMLVGSSTMDPSCATHVIRFWDHNVVIGKLVRRVPGEKCRLLLARALYRILDLAKGAGNMMVAIVVRPES